jgi:hypothetical protein
MSQQFRADSPQPGQAASRLMSGYDELTRVDLALREAERRLAAAHRMSPAQQGAQQAQALYLEVLALRDRARRVLTELADDWAADR